MKKSTLEGVLTKNPLTTINTNHLLLLFILALIVGFFLAWRFKKMYDPSHVIKAYLIYGIIHFFLGVLIFKVVFVIVIGSYLFGGILMIFRSNHYFYE